jgi:hypothetical protein
MSNGTFKYISRKTTEADGTVFHVTHDGHDIVFQAPERAPAKQLLETLAARVGETVEVSVTHLDATETFGMAVATVKANGVWYTGIDGDISHAGAFAKAGIKALNAMLAEKRSGPAPVGQFSHVS